jgi:hypothetical protein
MITAGQGFTTLTFLPGGNGFSGTFAALYRADVRNLWMLESSSWGGFKNWPLAGTAWTPPPVKAQAAAATPINVADAGTGSDSVSILRRANILDAGSGVEEVDVEAAFAVADAGTGVDTPAVRRILATIADSGAGADTIDITKHIVVFIQDAGAGLETLALAADITIPDTGAGAELLEVRKKLAAIADAGAGAEALAVKVPAYVFDSGTGADAIAGLKVQALIQETGSAAELLAVAARFTLVDAGAGADAVATAQKSLILIQDAGTGLDELAGILAAVGIFDEGAATEVLVVFRGSIPVFIQDAGQGADFVFVDPIGEPAFVFILDADPRERTIALRPRDRTAEPDSRGLSRTVDHVPNGGFEAWTAGLPDGWDGRASGAGVIAQDALVKRSGLYSLRMWGAGGADYAVVFSTFNLTAGRPYRIAVWTRGDGTSGSGLSWTLSDGLGGSWLGPTGSWAHFEQTWMAQYDGLYFQLFTLDFTAENTGVHTLTIQSGKGEAWADDVAVFDITAGAFLRPRDRILDVEPRDRTEDLDRRP